MLQNGSKKPTYGQNSTHQSNPFAAALAETEQHIGSPTQPTPGLDPFSEALLKSGNSFDAPGQNQFSQQQMLEKQRIDLEQKQRHEQLRRRLHEQINPVDLHSVFSARETEVKKEMELLRTEIRKLYAEVHELNKEVDIATIQEVVAPGQTGKYFVNFFQQLRKFIRLWRERVHSARTWARQTQAVAQQKKRGAGFNTYGYRKTKAVHDTMHHERSYAYGAG